MPSYNKPYSELTEEQKEKVRERSRRYYWEHREERVAYQRALDPAAKNQRSKDWRVKLKAEVYSHYGDRCACCGEANPMFLTLDHVNGGGYQHRKTVGGGLGMLLDIRKRGFPPEFQVLCFNCNQGRQLNGGICPHKE